MGVGDVAKRILLGQKLRSSQLGETLLPKRIALPVFASDALSSVAYAPDEIFIMLSLAGASAYVWSWKIGIAVALVMTAVVASYRQTVHAYPSGGGDYEVATVNLGSKAGTTVASALLVDYVLTVAVSISSGAQYAASAVGALSGHEATVATVLVILLAAMNLRGIRESGTFFAFPTYAFMVAILGMCAFGMLQLAAGSLPQSRAPASTSRRRPATRAPLTTFALMFLLARAFSSGCAALTGVEAISNGVPAFRRPKSQNAATTLLMLGAIAITMMLSVIALANKMGLKYVDPHDLDRLTMNGEPLPAGYDQHAVIAQIARAVFIDFPAGFYFIVTVTGVILVLAANTAFNGFPVLGSILAQDGYAPRALGSRGDRLAYSNGIVFLALMAIILIQAFDAEMTRLIQLYIVGVFVSFNLSQLGMIRHWTRHLRTEKDPQRTPADDALPRHQRDRADVHRRGAGDRAGHQVPRRRVDHDPGDDHLLRHHARHPPPLRQRRPGAGGRRGRQGDAHPRARHRPGLQAAQADPAGPRLRQGDPAQRARGGVRRLRPASTDKLLHEWEERNLGVPLKVLFSPYREVVKPIVDYATQIRKANPRGVVAVYIPEYVVGRWWEQLLHNQTALRLKGRLLFTPGVMVTSVPYQLRSSQIAREREEREATRVRAGDLRRGRVDDATQRPADPALSRLRSAPARRAGRRRCRRSRCPASTRPKPTPKIASVTRP